VDGTLIEAWASQKSFQRKETVRWVFTFTATAYNLVRIRNLMTPARWPMPFPLAHPAMAVPFRRLCPKYLDFPALIIGSIAPDFAACIDDWEYFSHTVLGSFVFCLPFGLLTLWIFRRVRCRFASSFPDPHRGALLPLCTGTPRSFLHVILSLLLGSWLHIVWDLFTHDYSWLVHRFAVLSRPIVGFQLHYLIWVLSSVIGIAIVIAVYGSLLRKRTGSLWITSPADRRAYALWCCILAVPFVGAVPLALHNAGPGYGGGSLLRILSMYYLGCAYVTLAITGFFLKPRAPVMDS